MSGAMQCVYIEWEDAGSIDESLAWVFKEDPPEAKVHMFKQVGFVFDCDPWSIILTEAHSADQMAPRTRIPLGMIRRFIDLDDTVKGD